MARRVIYKDVKTVSQAKKETKKLRGIGLNPAFTNALYISGRKKGISVYALANKKRVTGYKSRRVVMV